MANEKLPQLPSLTAITGQDLFYVVDVSDTTDDPTGSSKGITRDDILQNITGLTATTISATTYQNLPTDVFVTGGTYTSGNAIFTNNTGGTFTVSGFSVGGGGGQVFYLNLSQSQNGNRLLSTTASTASEQTSGVTIANGVTGTIASFQSQPLNITLLPGGIWSFYLHSYKEDSNATFNIFVEVYKRTSGGTETLLFATDPAPVTTNSPNPSMQLSDGYFSGTSLNVSDSVVAVVRATNTDNQSHIITFFTEGSTHYSYVVSTIPTQQGLTCDTLSGCSIIQTIQTDISNKFDKSGGTVNGDLTVTGNTSLQGVTATTISATTVYTNGFTANTTGVSATTISGGALNISGNTSEDLVRITQTGSGNALVVEDSSNPDSTPFVVNTSGFVGIGVTSPTNPLHISGSTDQIKLSNGSSVWTIASKSNGDFVAVASGTRASMYFGSYGTINSMRINSTGNIVVNSTNDSQFVGGGKVIINDGLSATTISATTISATTISGTTFYGDGTNLTGVVKGAGTTNYLPRWTGTTGLGNSQIQDDGTYVSISTSTALYGLQVYNSTTSSGGVGIRTYSDSGVGNQTGLISYGAGNIISGTSVGVYGFGIDGLLAIGVKGDVGNSEFGGVTTGIGGYFDGRGEGTYGYPSASYSVQLIDGTEGINKVLVSQTSDGKSNWVDPSTIQTAFNYGISYTMLTGNYMI